jgi:3-hydroxyacyl-[acyl-carrier-protein] dehydratase
MMDINEITRILPHRFPFLLVDRILDYTPGEKITGIKNVTCTEPFFQGHFPNYPIMPGVLIIESMAQVAAILAFKSQKGEEGDLIFLVGIDKAKFRKPVFPGDQMKIVAEVLHGRPPFWKIKGTCFVDGQRMVEAEFKAMVNKKVAPATSDKALPLVALEPTTSSKHQQGNA